MEGLVIAIIAGAQFAVIVYVVVLLRRMTTALASIAHSLWAIGKNLEKSGESQDQQERTL